MQRAEAVALVQVHQPPHDQHGADELRQHGGQRGAGHAHVEHGHEQQIQHQIGQPAGHEIQKRPPGIALGPQQSRADVVYHRDDRPGQIDAQIRHAQIEHVVRRGDPDEHRTRKDEAEHADGRARRRGQEHGAVNDLFQSLPVARAVVHGIKDARAGGQAQKQADEKIDERAGGAHGRQRLVAGERADHGGVDGVVKLLKQIGQENGEGERDQPARDGAFRQGNGFLFHFSLLFENKSFPQSPLLSRSAA